MTGNLLPLLLIILFVSSAVFPAAFADGSGIGDCALSEVSESMENTENTENTERTEEIYPGDVNPGDVYIDDINIESTGDPNATDPAEYTDETAVEAMTAGEEIFETDVSAETEESVNLPIESTETSAPTFNVGNCSYSIEYYFNSIAGTAPAGASTSGTAEEGAVTAVSAEQRITVDGSTYALERIVQATVTETESSNIVKVYYGTDLLSACPSNPYDPYEPDGISDNYQKTVTFKAKNGTLGTADDPGSLSTYKVVVTMYNDAGTKYSKNGTAYLSENQIPVPYANDGYVAESKLWSPTTPTASYPITDDALFTARYTEGTFKYTVSYYYDGVLGTNPADTVTWGEAKAGTVTNVSASQKITLNSTEHYALDGLDQITVSSSAVNNVVKVWYWTDELSENPKNPSSPKEPDGIPDKYQVIVNFMAENGTVSFDCAVVTLLGTDGTPSQTGSGSLSLWQIPNLSADDNCEPASPLWTPETPSTSLKITEPVTFTAHYVSAAKSYACVLNNTTHSVAVLTDMSGNEVAECLSGGMVYIDTEPDRAYFTDSVSVTDDSGNSVSTERLSDGRFCFVMPGGAVEVVPAEKERSLLCTVPALAGEALGIGEEIVIPDSGGCFTLDTCDPVYAVHCAYSTDTSGDAHKAAPTHTTLYRTAPCKEKDGFTLTEMVELADFVKYVGASIRTSGNPGMRIVYGIPQTVYTGLCSASGIDGLRLKEFGTVAVWTKTGVTPVLGCQGCLTAYAYRENEYNDTELGYSGSCWTYANAFVFTSMENTVPDLTVRPYVILEETETGKTVTLYGGTVVRNVGFVAYLNKDNSALDESGKAFVNKIAQYVYPGGYHA